MSNQSQERANSGKQLAKNAAWNFASPIIPLFFALFCIPQIIEIAGSERFGILMLAWALIGYAGLFDFGLGRALTKTVSEQLATNHNQISNTILTGLIFICVIGIIFGFLFYFTRQSEYICQPGTGTGCSSFSFP